MAEEYDIVAGSSTGVPILILPEGAVFLRTGRMRKGHMITRPSHRNNPLYTGTLTDEEEALAMKYILLGTTNNG